MKVRVVFMLFILTIGYASIIFLGKSETIVEADYYDQTSGLNLIGKPSGLAGMFLVFRKTGIYYSSDEQRIESGKQAIVSFKTFYHWYEHLESVKIYQVFKNNNMKPRLLEGVKNQRIAINLNQEGDYYFQGKSQVKSLTGNKTFYSKVMIVHVNPIPTDVSDFHIKIDDKYLNSFKNSPSHVQAQAIIHPKKASGVVQWSVDNNNLATIDPDSGLISANSDRKFGFVTVKGELIGNHNFDVKFFDTQKLYIGLGLDNQTVEEGENATFTIQGDIVEGASGIDWYKKKKYGMPSNIPNEHSKSLTVKEVNTEKAKYAYFARIHLPTNEDGKNVGKLETNYATINIIHSDKPQINMKFAFVNETLNHLFPGELMLRPILRRVAPKDNILMKGTITENNKSSFIKNGKLEFKVPNRIQNLRILINKSPVANDYDKESNTVTINNFDFSQTKNFDIDASYTIENIQNEKFVTKPVFQGIKDESDQSDLYTIDGEPLEMDFVKDELKAAGNSIKFLVNHIKGAESSAYGQINDPDGKVLTFQDDRRIKGVTSIYVHLKGYTNSNSQPKFYYCPPNSAPKLITNDLMEVYKTQDGEPLSFLTWKRNIKVVIPKDYPSTGSFKASILWVIK